MNDINKPMRVIEFEDNDGDDDNGVPIYRAWWECPNCYNRMYAQKYDKCPRCEQKLKW